MSSLLPNGKQHFDDNNGRPLVGGRVYYYIPNTSTPKDTWQDEAMTILNTNPIILDARGECTAWGIGRYRQVVRDQLGNLIWDKIVVDFTGLLADPDGAQYIGFQQAGANSVVTTVLEKLRQTVSIEDKAGAPGVALSEALDLLEQVHVPATQGTLQLQPAEAQAVLGDLSLVNAEGPLSITFAPGVYTFNTSDQIARIGQNQNVSLIGAAPLITTITGAPTVGGSSGNYICTYPLASAAGVVPGQVLRIDNMPGGATYFQATPVRAPYDGELAVGFNRMGGISSSGTTCTVSGNVAANLAVGYLVHIKGQTRVITGLPTANTFTINTALDLDVSGYQWWYYTLPASGTISTSGRSVTVTGSGSAFTSAANAGDFILADGVMVEIASVDSASQVTLVAAQTFAAGTPYTIVRGSILHEGSFEILSVAGNEVTVRSRSQVRPPSVGVVSGGTATVIRTVLKQTGSGNGFLFERGGVLREMSNIALVGSGSSASSIGLAMSGSGAAYNQGSSLMVLGENAAVIEFGFGAFMSAGCVLFGWKAHICNNLNAGMEAIDGASWYLRAGVVSHNRDIGVLSSGGYGRISEARFCGNRLQGIRQDVGSAIYGDSAFAWGNGSHGVLGVNRSGIQFADGYIIKSGGNGVNVQNGAGGRFSRTLIAGSSQHAMSVDGCHDVEATQGWCTGSRAGQSGLVVSSADIKFGDGASTGNAAAGMFAPTGGTVYAPGVYVSKNGTNGARADTVSQIICPSSYLSGNTGADTLTSGGVIFTDRNPNGTWQMGAMYSQVVTLANDSVLVVDIGDATICVNYVSGSSTTLTGAVRARSGAGGGSISQAYGGGITILQNTVLTGTTGTPGDFTMSVSTNGNFYAENRAGAARQITITINGSRRA